MLNLSRKPHLCGISNLFNLTPWNWGKVSQKRGINNPTAKAYLPVSKSPKLYTCWQFKKITIKINFREQYILSGISQTLNLRKKILIILVRSNWDISLKSSLLEAHSPPVRPEWTTTVQLQLICLSGLRLCDINSLDTSSLSWSSEFHSMFRYILAPMEMWMPKYYFKSFNFNLTFSGFVSLRGPFKVWLLIKSKFGGGKKANLGFQQNKKTVMWGG